MQKIMFNFIFSLTMANKSYNIGKGSICILSYNSRGFTEEKQDICKLLFVKNEKYYPVLCNQENFLLKANCYKVSQCIPNARILFKEAIKYSFDGRPKNGMFIAIPVEIKGLIRDVSPPHWRVQAAVLSTASNKILIINSYFPTDPKLKDFDTTDLHSTLAAIEGVLSDNEYDSVIWGGDINADFIRNTTFTTTVERFIDDNSFEKSWDKFSIDYTHSSERDDHTFISTIDHFFWSEGLSHLIMEADVIHLPNNTSDHSPIYCRIDIDTIPPKKSIAEQTQTKTFPSWKKATIMQKETYKGMLEEQLGTINVSMDLSNCCNVHCHDVNHTHDCDRYLIDILESIKSSAASCLPSGGNKKTRENKKSLVMNWKEDIQPFKDKAMFWHAVWMSAGKPINTTLHQLMKRVRNVYHYQIRKNRKMAECIKKNTLLDACINDKGDIFKEIRKLRKTPPIVSSLIDGVANNIEFHFADVYEMLFS